MRAQVVQPAPSEAARAGEFYRAEPAVVRESLGLGDHGHRQLAPWVWGCGSEEENNPCDGAAGPAGKAPVTGEPEREEAVAPLIETLTDLGDRRVRRISERPLNFVLLRTDAAGGESAQQERELLPRSGINRGAVQRFLCFRGLACPFPFDFIGTTSATSIAFTSRIDEMSPVS